jgi:hypothetical protein
MLISKALVTAFYLMLLLDKPLMVCGELLAMLNLCHTLSVPWNQYELRLDCKIYRRRHFRFCEICQMQRPPGQLLTLRINILGVRFLWGQSYVVSLYILHCEQ